jgi:hypothetical protein
MWNAEFVGAALHQGRLATGDDRDVQTKFLQCAQTKTIFDIKRFKFFAVIAEYDAAIGQHAVDIEAQ